MRPEIKRGGEKLTQALTKLKRSIGREHTGVRSAVESADGLSEWLRLTHKAEQF